MGGDATENGDFPIRKQRLQCSIFPKRFLSWGFKTLFASASSCQCKPLHFFSPAGLCWEYLHRPRSFRRGSRGPSCIARARACACACAAIYLPDISGSHFSYTKNRVRRGRDFIYTKIAKNLDVMGFEPMTSGLEPASLTTGSNGSLFENGRG